jgi:cytoskeletal protein CcmA (bactofilin family)
MSSVAHIGPSIHIKGEIKANEPLTIDGHVSGSIDVSGHPLTVTTAAQIDADVLAHTIVVGGSIKGTLSAEERVVLEQTATLTGDLSAPNVTVHDGAVLHGRFEIAGRRKPQPVALAS